ncbi:MAG TPA: ATP-binding protein [Rhodothermales bacterium]
MSELRFRLMVEAVKDYAIFMLDPDGYVVSWNEGAERIKGYTESEIVGQHFSVFYPPEALAEDWPARELEIVAREGRLEDEGWRVRRDGSRFWANVVITAVRNSEGTLIGFAKVTRDMSDRRRLEDLELSERRMTEFLAMLSHELRNPLAPIRNAVSTMYLKEVDDPDLKWARNIVDRQVRHLTQLVDDLLDISRITSGTIRIKREPVVLGTVIERAAEAITPLVRARRHQMEVHVPDDRITVNGDATRLAQVVTNLLNNAAKYTPEGGNIRVSLSKENELAVIRVRDNGEGIPPDMLKSIFDLFRQGERTLDRSEGGLGIGLTLVRELVGRHDGAVEARSEGPGRGSEFTVRIPVAEVEVPPEHESPRPREKEASPQRRPRIMVVDDNPDIAESMVMLLDMWGFEVRSAHDGPTAIDLAARYRPTIVLLDIGLPNLNGYEVARLLQQQPGGSAMTLIALTGYGQKEDIRRSQESGFRHHIVKPADPDELLALLEKVSSAQG